VRTLVVTNMYPTAREPWFGSFVKDQVEALELQGADISVFAFDGRGTRLAYVRATGAVRRLVGSGRFDLVHAHYGLSGAVALAQRRVPVVTTFHGSDTGYVRWQVPVSWVVARLSTPVFVAEAGARRLGLPGSEVIPCGVDARSFVPCERGEARELLGWARDRRYVLFPGSPANAVKRFDLFAAAVAALRPASGLEAIALAGFSRADVPLVMNAADVLVMTSDREGSPVTVKEALACRTPVVSVRVGDVPEVIAGLPGCSVTRRDPRELARAIAAALEAERSEALRERALEFSQERVAQRLLGVYRDALQRRS
jgi:teichuronic acid biosynthesis glycosyltransferase TuaC